MRNGREEYQCMGCHYIGGLNVHGRCDRCNSEAVLSQELLVMTGNSGMRVTASVQRVRTVRMRGRIAAMKAKAG
jgi:uncharacterized paraquat-inducible protein A